MNNLKWFYQKISPETQKETLFGGVLGGFLGFFYGQPCQSLITKFCVDLKTNKII